MQTAALFRPCPNIDDGRNANNGWLQETPQPHTGLVWDNALLLSPKTAASLGVDNGDHVEVTINMRQCIGPAWITPGHADHCVTLPLGYGRVAAGTVGNGVGFDAYMVRQLNYPDQIPATLRKRNGHTDLVSTQPHHRMEGAELIKSVGPSGSVERERTGYGFHDLSARWDQTPGVPQWGMSIDLDRCIGCNACVVACQSENNIPTVGKEEVRLGREMHWIRIDRYYAGKDLDNPESLLQPVTCMHCETAPCEPVCPVAATVHSHEGLNQMVYNRCVGTRYCSNNCPYKVRRFNYLNYQLLQPNYEKDQGIQLLRLLNNPDVTVRSRGVMEKCSYCIQRITSARIKAKEEGRRIADGEVTPACAQACPTKTIVFGDLTDPKSAVRVLRQDPREYPLLPEEMTMPRTTYLARIANPNKELPNA
jgi:molybdopterin-containing oxidoreductase family iron-sulfur binding subunit